MSLLKYKYWDSTDIVLRSYEIGKKEKAFSIFKNQPNKFKDFINNIDGFFANHCPIIIIGVIIDQRTAFNKNWSQKTVIKSAYSALFSNFIRLLSLQNDSGEIIQEASTPLQDITIYEKFYNLQTSGLPKDNLTNEEVKKRLTALSFVTKKHMDTEAQLADL